MIMPHEIEKLVSDILASSKYQMLARETVADVVETEVSNGPRSRKELERLA